MTQDAITPTAFIKRLSELDRSKSEQEKFRDFCEMAYCAYAKLMASEEKAEALEARYMQIVGTYRDKDAVRAYPDLLAQATFAVADGQDFLGVVSSQLDILNERQGQFFTPYSVSKMMAAMTLQDAGDIIEAKGFITLGEPAAGAGGMVLAAADTLMTQGYDPLKHLLVLAVDVSPLCYWMCYLQLTFKGIPAFVEQSNTLSLERFDAAWTLPTRYFYAHHGRLFDAEEALTPDATDVSMQEQPPTAEASKPVLLQCQHTMNDDDIPLQRDMFTEALVDTRSRRQKQAVKADSKPKQMEMFKQRDIAQFGVTANPVIDIPSERLLLIAEDPRTEEEKELDLQREAASLTKPMFEKKPTKIEASPSLHAYLDVVQAAEQYTLAIWQGHTYNTASNLPSTIIESTSVGLCAEEIEAAMHIGQARGNQAAYALAALGKGAGERSSTPSNRPEPSGGFRAQIRQQHARVRVR